MLTAISERLMIWIIRTNNLKYYQLYLTETKTSAPNIKYFKLSSQTTHTNTLYPEDVNYGNIIKHDSPENPLGSKTDKVKHLGLGFPDT